jgi:uncharacterized protein (TIGR03118 family)
MARRFSAILATSMLLPALALPTVADAHGPSLYSVTNLVSDGTIPALHTDANLVNGWGLVAGPTTPWWVANNGTDTSTLYDGTGVARPLVVAVPGGPTGAVFNGSSTDFVVTDGTSSGAARFLFANESGMVLGWSPTVPPLSTQAQVGADRSSVGAIYKGLALGQSNGASFLYATDFHNGRVDVFNASFALQSWAGAFTDPSLPAGYAPFGIANLGGRLFVTFAKQDAAAKDEVDGEGLGIVDVFGTDGSFGGRVASFGSLDAPWGLAWAPAGFGRFSGDLLVGNFGDGRIHGYRWGDDGWEDQGPLRAGNHRPITVDGLWGIGFGNGAASGPTTTLYFASGPDGEAHGLFGSIAVR